MSGVLNNFFGDWHALLILLVAGVIPNQIWRMLGLWLGGGLDEGSEFLVWVRAVATAILAGVIVNGADFNGADLASTRLIDPIGFDAAKNFDKARNLDRLLRE